MIDFEANLKELNQLVELLEKGELSLDDSLAKFERGVQLTRQCQKALDKAEQKVEILLGKESDGALSEFAAPQEE